MTDGGHRQLYLDLLLKEKLKVKTKLPHYLSKAFYESQ